MIGTYTMTPEVTSEINNKLDDIYKYNFPPNKSYAILVHDFKLDSRDVVENKISYNGEPNDNSVKEEVLNAVKKKDLYNTRISFTQYEPSDKSDPRSPMSNRHRANYLIMIVDKNVAVTVFLTSKRQWEEKTFYRDEGWNVDEYIRYDQIGAHARLLPKYEKNLGNTTNEDSTLIEISKEVNESWIMEWINSSKK